VPADVAETDDADLHLVSPEMWGSGGSPAGAPYLVARATGQALR
jgi:hypothetical protein